MNKLQQVKAKLEEMKAKYNQERDEEDFPNHSDGNGMYWSGVFACLKEISYFVDQLEEKGVDLDEETLHSELRKIYASVYDSKDIEAAKHFYELGLNTSNPLTWEDIVHIKNIINTIAAEVGDEILIDDEFGKEVLKRFKAQKGE